MNCSPRESNRNYLLPNEKLAKFVHQDEPSRVGQREKKEDEWDRFRVADIVESRNEDSAQHYQVAEAAEQKDPEIPGLFEDWKRREEGFLAGSQAEKWADLKNISMKLWSSEKF